MKFKHLLKTSALTAMLLLAGKVGFGQVYLVNEGFNGGTTAPAGWTFTSIGGTYTSAGNFGETSPSIKFDATNDRVVTPTFSNGDKLSFWLKGQSTDANSKLFVEQYDGTTWTTVEEIIPIPNTATTKTYTLLATTIQVRFTYTKSAGNLAFDDVKVTEKDTQAPTLSTISPANNATDIAINTTLSLTLNENITKGIGSILVKKVVGDAQVYSIDVATSSVLVSGTNATITIPEFLENNMAYYIIIPSGCFTDIAGNAFAGITVNTDWTFTTTATPVTTLRLDYPNGGEKFYAGQSVEFKWAATSDIANVTIDVSTDNGNTWITPSFINSTPANTGKVTATIPSDASYSNQYVVRISDAANSTMNDLSNSTFTVIATPSINAIQSNMSDGDRSIYNGSVVRFSGIVTAKKSTGSGYYVQSGDGANNGILIYASPTPVAVGDNVTIEGTVKEYLSTTLYLTEIDPLASVFVNSQGNTLPNAAVITTAQMLESYEGVLVRVVNAEVKTASTIDDGSGVANIANDLYSYPALTIGSKYTITGIGSYSGGMYKILPRSADYIKSAIATVSSTKYTVNDVAGTITNIPFSTSLATFKANITAVVGATGFDVFDDEAGTTAATVLDDTKFVVVTAADGITKKSYTITRNAVLTGKDFTAFSITTLSLHTGVIADPNISVELGFSDLKNDLVPVFTASPGATVKIGSTVQESGVTHNDFSATGSLVYTVTAENGDTKEWTVTVTNAAAPLTGNDILTYSIAGVNATVNATLHTVEVAVPFSSDLADLVATYTLSEKATAKIGAVLQESGVTHNDFTATGSLTYTITAEDGTPQDWTVTVTKAPASTDATLKDLKYNTTTVADFNASTLKYFVTLPFGSAIPSITATPNNDYANTNITLPTDLSGDVTARTATVLVTAESGATKTYLIVFRIDNSEKELFFSEYIEGSSNTKAIEIYNPTPTSVDLSGYTIKTSTNGYGFGKTSAGESATNVIQLTGTLAAGDVYVIYNPGSVQAVKDKGDLASAAYPGAGCNISSFNGNDALALYKGTTLIDVFGFELTTPIDGPKFNVAGVATAAENHTIIRKPTVTKGSIDWTASAGTTADNSEWIVKEIDYFTNLGSHNMFLPAPATTTDKNTLPNFGSIVSGTVGTGELSFTVGGVYLSSNIVITAPAGFEISTLSGANFVSSSPISLAPTSGIVAPTTIYVKFHPTAIQAYSGNITIENDDVTTKVVAVSGTGIDADAIAPSFSAEYPKFGNVGPFTLDVLVKTDEIGYVYFHKVAKDAAAPSVADIKSLGTIIDVLVENTEYSASVTGLTDATAYDFYFVAEDKQATPNTSSAVMKQVTTETIPIYTIAQIQTPTDGTGNSPKVDLYVKTSGVVTSVKYASTGGAQVGFTIQDAAGAWNGIYVYTPTPVSILDNVNIKAMVKEYNKLTELLPVDDVVTINGQGSLPAVTEVTTLAANDEKYEGVLIKVNLATCAAGGGSGTYSVDDQTGALKIYKGLYADLALIATHQYRITGVLFDNYYNSVQTYELNPRSAGDIIDITTGIDDNFNSSLTVYPNPFTNEIRFDGTDNVKHVVITNITGQIVKNEAVDMSNRISTSELNKGMYFVTFINDKGAKATKKMIKQ